MSIHDVNIQLGDEVSGMLYEAMKLSWDNRPGAVVEMHPSFSGWRAIRPDYKPADCFEGMGSDGIHQILGNVIFVSDSKPSVKQIEAVIAKDFGLVVPVLLLDLPAMQKIIKGLPEKWLNDATMKCDVMFLWPELDHPDIVEQIPHNPEIEDVIYLPGAVVWRIDRDKVNRGKVLRIVGTDTYKQLTIRNPNSVRKIYALMQTAAQAT